MAECMGDKFDVRLGSSSASPAAEGTLRNRLALRPIEAAKALGISDRTLWDLTKRNAVPHVRVGKRLLYPVHDLQKWLSDQAVAGQNKQT